MSEAEVQRDPQEMIDELLGTSDKSEQLKRIGMLMVSQPITLLVTANPVSGEMSLSTLGSPSFNMLYKMLDFARDGIMGREKQALIEAVSRKEDSSQGSDTHDGGTALSEQDAS